jgi:hypothetical protein
MVDVSIDGRRLGSVLADQFRADLASARIGNGDHGFVLRSAEILPPVEAAAIRAVAHSASGVHAELGFLSRPDAADASEVAIKQRAMPFRGHSEDEAQRPVFVLGAARSGTSAIAQALVATTRYVGHEEGHLLDLTSAMVQLVAHHYQDRAEEWRDRQNTMIAAVSAEFFEAGIRHIFVELARTLFPAGWWLDKTPRPAMIIAAPILRRIWPEARFIFMKRRGIENIISRMTKFPALSFEDHCRDWRAAMESWVAIRDALAGAAIEIDQLAMATRPD